jgi:glycosyltransferase involved in cell wall biosynthesis
VHLFLNALAASAASGFTYVRNVAPYLRRHSDIKATILTSGLLRGEFSDSSNVSFRVAAEGYSAVRRFWFEQSKLPHILRQSATDVLISAGNFALRNSPVPQILLSGNALYCSEHFSHDLLLRHEYRAWMDLRLRSWLAKRSIHWAELTVAPSGAFARELEAWSGKKVTAVHHGFDQQLFRGDPGPLPLGMRTKLAETDGAIRLLYVSHYNYFRNFETLFRALPLIKQQLSGRKVKLVLTCELKPGADTRSYDPTAAADLIRNLGIEEEILQLGVVPYPLVYHVCRVCDVYVSSSYAETFAHPTVEAMSCGLPIVASDLAVHREICQDAAVYFPRFSPETLARCVSQVVQSPELAAKLATRGLQRALDFSWETHVSELVAIAENLSKNCTLRRKVKDT